MLLRLPHILLPLLFSPFSFAAGSDPYTGALQSPESPELKPLITRGNVLLSAGQFFDAAKAYSDAIELSPASYLLYYKRATAYLSLGRHTSALTDYDKVIDLTDGAFNPAWLSKAKLLGKEGRWNDAKRVMQEYKKKVGASDKESVDVLFSISEGEVAERKAIQAHRSKNYHECIEQATVVLQTATHSVDMRELRVTCSLNEGDVDRAVGDLTRLTHITPPSSDLFTLIANLSYFFTSSDPTQALQTLKQCLHYDPDSKLCRQTHKEFRELEKMFVKLETLESASDWMGMTRVVIPGKGKGVNLAAKLDELLEAAASESSLPPRISASPQLHSTRRRIPYRAACKAYIKLNDPRKAKQWCEEVLRMDGDDVDGLVGMGEMRLVEEEWEDAVRLFSSAFEKTGNSSGEIREKLDRARRLLKQSKAKDYYKVLGVSRDADQRTIKKAYRKTAMTAHPDKGGSEAKMASVNEAYEVLSKPELRQRFDNGDDPNDPTSGQQGGFGNPFHQGGNPFQFQQGFFHGQNPFGQGGFHWSG